MSLAVLASGRVAAVSLPSEDHVGGSFLLGLDDLVEQRLHLAAQDDVPDRDARSSFNVTLAT